MIKKRISYLLSVPVLLLSLGAAPAAERELLYPNKMEDLRPELREIVRQMRDTGTAPIDYDRLGESRQPTYFARIGEKQRTVAQSPQGYTLNDTARLGGKPFVFVTTPESLYGRSLLKIYEDIGYEAEDIVSSQRAKDQVAIIFRLPAEISLSSVKDGKLPTAWHEQVYSPTWDNMFSLFSRLVESGGIWEKPQAAEDTNVQNRAFVLNFPEEGKLRIKETDYACLRAVGGADWKYRSLLESQLSVFEHFRGTGLTQNEVTDPTGKLGHGLPEFVVPNRRPLKDFSELAVVDLGQLIITDTYSR